MLLFAFQVPSPPNADDLVYADADYKDLYDYGPFSYRNATKAKSVTNEKEEPKESASNGQAREV